IQATYGVPSWDVALADGFLDANVATGWLVASDWSPERVRYETFTRPAEDPRPHEPAPPRTVAYISPTVARRRIRVRDEITGELVDTTVEIEVPERIVDQLTGEPAVDNLRGGRTH